MKSFAFNSSLPRANARSLACLVVGAVVASWAIPARADDPPATDEPAPERLPPPPAPERLPPPPAPERLPPPPASEPRRAPEVVPLPPPPPEAAPAPRVFVHPAPQPVVDDPIETPQREWSDVVGRFELGYRGVFVTNPGYNPFSARDYFSGVAMALTHTLIARSGMSLAIGLGWDYGQSSATSLGDSTTLSVHRITVPIEGRIHFGKLGYAFARVAPGAAHESLELDDSSAPNPYTQSNWLFTTDASVGYSIPVIPIPARHARGTRAWLQGEFGYSWVADNELNLHSAAPANDPEVVSGLQLQTLGLRGAFFRLMAAISY